MERSLFISGNLLWNSIISKFSPGFVPMSDLLIFHLGIRGSSVWKKTHMQIPTRAASTP